MMLMDPILHRHIYIKDTVYFQFQFSGVSLLHLKSLFPVQNLFFYFYFIFILE